MRMIRGRVRTTGPRLEPRVRPSAIAAGTSTEQRSPYVSIVSPYAPCPSGGNTPAPPKEAALMTRRATHRPASARSPHLDGSASKTTRRPLPHIPGHIRLAVNRWSGDYPRVKYPRSLRSSGSAAGTGLRQVFAMAGPVAECSSPSELILEAAACGPFPLGFRSEAPCPPISYFARVLVGDVDNQVGERAL